MRVMMLPPFTGSQREPSWYGMNGKGLDSELSTSMTTCLPSSNAPITCVALRSGPLIHCTSLPSPPRRR